MDLSSENNVGFRFNDIQDGFPSWLTKEEVDNILDEISHLLNKSIKHT